MEPAQDQGVRCDAGDVGVGVGLLPSGVLKGVAAEEELAYISPNVVLDDKFASGMVPHELGHVKHQVVEDDQAIPFRESLIELLQGDDRIGISEGSLSPLHNLEHRLKDYH